MSHHGWYHSQDNAYQGQTGWYGSNGPFADGGQPEDSAYDRDYGIVDGSLDIYSQTFNDDTSSVFQPPQFPKTQPLEAEQRWTQGDRFHVSTNDGYYPSAVTQNEVPSPTGYRGHAGIQNDAYTPSMHSDSWSPTGSVRPRAGSFTDGSDGTRPHLCGGGKLRRDEMRGWMENDGQFRRSTAEDIRGISGRLPEPPPPKPSKLPRSSRGKHTEHHKRPKSQRRQRHQSHPKHPECQGYPEYIRQEDLEDRGDPVDLN